DLVSRVQSEVPPVTNYRQFPMPAAPVPQELAVVEDPRKAGIVPWPEPAQAGAVLFRRRGVPPPPGANQPPPRYQPGALDQAQQVILRYVEGEQTPQTREDFERAAGMFRAEWQKSPDFTFTESRMLFCEGRALLFRRPGESRIPAKSLADAKEL